LDIRQLEELLQLLDKKEIAEFELEEEGMKLRIRKSAASANHAPAASLVPMIVPAAAPAAPAAPTEAAPAAAQAASAEADESLALVKSPIVGTFYRSPDPNAPAFVQVGDQVRVGQVLCIIEAMKLMNEIESEVAGEIVKIHHENGQPVQYAEPLFSIRPDR